MEIKNTELTLLFLSFHQINPTILYSGISTNSKEIKKNYIFFAIKGNKTNGEKYINDAIQNGASVIICSKKGKIKNKSITIIKSSNLRGLLSEVASKFYKLKPKNIVAVTSDITGYNQFT